MSSQASNIRVIGAAEKSFRSAFERLIRGQPQILPRGVKVSQNNVAREAGCDPSALRKARYPSLIRDIQVWKKEHESDIVPSRHKAALSRRKRNRSLRKKIRDLKAQRDLIASLLIEADAKILDLTMENARLHARQNSHVRSIGNNDEMPR